MFVRRLKKRDYRVEWGDGPDAPRNEPDNENNSRPVYQKITKKFTLIIERKIYPVKDLPKCNRGDVGKLAGNRVEISNSITIRPDYTEE